MAATAVAPVTASDSHTAPASPDASALSNKRGATFFNVLLVALVALGILAYRLPLFSPGLYVAAPVFHFGTVTAGAAVRHKFTIRNLHPWPVIVTRVQGGCGCTKGFVGRDEPFRLMPGEAVQVNATLDTDSKKGVTEQTLVVTTKDGREDTALVLKGIILPGS